MVTQKCRKQFCAAHRFPSDHTCTPAAPTTTARLGAKSNQIRDAARDALRKNASPAASKPTTASSKPSAPSETATKKVKAAQDLWNTRNPEKVALAYTVSLLVLAWIRLTDVISLPTARLSLEEP